MRRYCGELSGWYESWDEFIAYFYDGKILRMHEAGSEMAEGKGRMNPAKVMEGHMVRVISSMAAGVGTRSMYHKGMLKHGARHLIRGVRDAEEYAVR